MDRPTVLIEQRTPPNPNLEPATRALISAAQTLRHAINRSDPDAILTAALARDAADEHKALQQVASILTTTPGPDEPSQLLRTRIPRTPELIKAGTEARRHAPHIERAKAELERARIARSQFDTILKQTPGMADHLGMFEKQEADALKDLATRLNAQRNLRVARARAVTTHRIHSPEGRQQAQQLIHSYLSE